jgi:hypothetical protein
VEGPLAKLSKRSRIIGALMILTAVAAIVAHFGADRLHMQWIRPIAELIILAEILVFIVLERFELFEPVHESMQDFHASLREMDQRLDTRLARLEHIGEALAVAGEVTVQASAAEMFRTAARLLREELAIDPGDPQILRTARLSGKFVRIDDPIYRVDELDAIKEFVTALRAYDVVPGGEGASPWAHLWSKRILLAIGDLASFEAFTMRLPLKGRPAAPGFAIAPHERARNLTIKVVVEAQPQAALSPLLILGERAVCLTFEDPSHPAPHWGIFFRGARYASLFARWHDEVWQRPDAYTIYSRDGVNERELERVRGRLEALAEPPPGEVKRP